MIIKNNIFFYVMILWLKFLLEAVGLYQTVHLLYAILCLIEEKYNIVSLLIKIL